MDKHLLRIYLRIFITALLAAGACLLCADNGNLGSGLPGALLICCTSILLYRLGELRKSAAETKKQLDETLRQLNAVQEELKHLRQAKQDDKRPPYKY